MLIKFLEEFCNNDKIFHIITEKLQNISIFSAEKIENYTKFFISSLLKFFKNNFDENIFKSGSFQFFSQIEIQNVNFEKIIIGFSIFSEEFLKNYFDRLSKQEILTFLNGMDKFLYYLGKTYSNKLKEFYDKIFNSISNGILILDKNLKILKANKSFYNIIGSFDNISMKNLHDVLKDREGIDILKLQKQCLQNEKLQKTELIIKRKDGKKYHRTIYADLLKDKNHVHEGYIVYIQDTDYENYLKDTFSKYLSRQVAQKILNERNINLNGERKNIAVMFVDIRNFTEFSEKNPPEYVLEVLNRYFNLIIDIVFQFGGTLDKFIGDAAMVIFGAPVEYEDSIERCINCAIAIQKGVKKISEEDSNFKLGIGINFGEAVVGNIGSHDKRIEYTAIGDVVNTADRVQRITPGEKIYITENVADNLDNENFNIKFLKEARFKGKSKLVKIFEVVYH